MAGALSLLFPHVATTHGVVVRVAVSYLADQSSPAADRWFWSYHVRIENGRDGPVQLLARHWLIEDGRGRLHEVRGAGVVGETPRIEPGESFDYVSGCPLDTSSGAMKGYFHLIDEAGSTFDVAIPRFSLDDPSA